MNLEAISEINSMKSQSWKFLLFFLLFSDSESFISRYHQNTKTVHRFNFRTHIESKKKKMEQRIKKIFFVVSSSY